MNLPTSFTDSRKITAQDVKPNAEAALRSLASKGYEVYTGLTPELSDQILTMSQEPAIKEYCPKDSSQRFSERAAAEQWLAKGRAFFTLQTAGQLVGYGWAGPAASSHVPDGATTFALRIGQAGHGQGLATPFSWVTIIASARLFGLKDFWLETWASNGAAVHIYHKLQFEDVTQAPGHRQTARGQRVDDTRMYMRLPNARLES